MKKNISTIHSAELELAQKFIEICNEMNLNYFMIGGTELGAVRHNGFIPWDDDMDFGMMREDYDVLVDRLLSSDTFKLDVAHYSNGKTLDYPLKIQDKSILIVDSSTSKRIERPVWIDIFPIDGMPNNAALRKAHQFNLMFLRLMVKYSKFSDNVAINANIRRSLIEKILIGIGKVIKPEKYLNRDNWMNRLDKCLKRYPTYRAKYSVNFMGAYKFREMFPSVIYREITSYKFDDFEMFGIKNYDRYLSQMYGDYMQVPDKEYRNKHKTELKNINKNQE